MEGSAHAVPKTGPGAAGLSACSRLLVASRPVAPDPVSGAAVFFFFFSHHIVASQISSTALKFNSNAGPLSIMSCKLIIEIIGLNCVSCKVDSQHVVRMCNVTVSCFVF